MSHFALYREERFENLHEYCRSYLPEFNFQKRWQGKVRNPATNTVHAVYDLLAHCNSCFEVLERAVNFGGDTDSVAAIAMGIASTRMRDELPDFLEHDLEAGSQYGVSFLKDLGKLLMDKYQ